MWGEPSGATSKVCWGHPEEWVQRVLVLIWWVCVEEPWVDGRGDIRFGREVVRRLWPLDWLVDAYSLSPFPCSPLPEDGRRCSGELYSLTGDWLSAPPPPPPKGEIDMVYISNMNGGRSKCVDMCDGCDLWLRWCFMMKDNNIIMTIDAKRVEWL
jgi:hypothetical protein